MDTNDSQENNDTLGYEWLNTVVEKAKVTHKKEIEIYRLWKEYLKRSWRYNLVCRWFEETRSAIIKHDDLDNESFIMYDFNSFVDTYLLFNSYLPSMTLEAYFEGALGDVKNGQTSKSSIHQFFHNAFVLDFPFEDEMLMNYFVFGNVYKETDPFTTFRFVLLTEIQKRSSVSDMENTIEMICEFAEREAISVLGREPTLKEYKIALLGMIKHDVRLHLSIANPYGNKETILKQVSGLIDSRRKDNPELLKKYKRKDIYKGTGRFEISGKNIHIDELQKYLDVYDQKKTGKTNIELAEIFHPELEVQPKSEFKDHIIKIDANAKKTADTYIGRYINKAEKIISNVESGIFRVTTNNKGVYPTIYAKFIPLLLPNNQTPYILLKHLFLDLTPLNYI